MTWSAILPIIAPFVLGLLFKLIPSKESGYKSPLTLKQLAEKYKGYDTYSIILLMILIPVMTFLFGLFFDVLFHLTTHKQEAAIFIVKPDSGIWYAIGLILAFGLIMLPMNLIFRNRLQEDYKEYILYTNIKYGYDGMEVYKYMSGLLNLLAMVLLFLITDFSVEVFEDKVAVNELLEFKTKEYRFKEMEKVHFIQFDQSTENSNLVPNPTYLISFKDGTRWNTNYFITDNEGEKSMVDYIRQKTGIPVDTFKTVSELDLASH